MYKLFFKRFLDCILSLVALIILSPILVVVAVLVKIKLGSPILFKQQRPGKDEKIFKIYKFRTMSNKTDADGNLLADEFRLTKFTKFLRATSLDELPELFNILKGDMSIVGPRPLLVQYLPLYNSEQKKRHQVRPGLSGLAQVNGRNAITWEDKFKYDVKYVQSMSFILDMKIILNTVLKVCKREGINSNTAETMEEFRGNKDE